MGEQILLTIMLPVSKINTILSDKTELVFFFPSNKMCNVLYKMILTHEKFNIPSHRM